MLVPPGPGGRGLERERERVPERGKENFIWRWSFRFFKSVRHASTYRGIIFSGINKGKANLINKLILMSTPLDSCTQAGYNRGERQSDL